MVALFRFRFTLPRLLAEHGQPRFEPDIGGTAARACVAWRLLIPDTSLLQWDIENISIGLPYMNNERLRIGMAIAQGCKAAL